MEIKSLTNQLDYLVHRKGEAHAAHRTGGVSIEQGFFRAVTKICGPTVGSYAREEATIPVAASEEEAVVLWRLVLA